MVVTVVGDTEVCGENKTEIDGVRQIPRAHWPASFRQIDENWWVSSQLKDYLKKNAKWRPIEEDIQCGSLAFTNTYLLVSIYAHTFTCTWMPHTQQIKSKLENVRNPEQSFRIANLNHDSHWELVWSYIRKEQSVKYSWPKTGPLPWRMVLLFHWVHSFERMNVEWWGKPCLASQISRINPGDQCGRCRSQFVLPFMTFAWYHLSNILCC